MGYGEHGDALATMWRRATLIGEADDTGTQQLLKKLRGLKSEEPEDVYRPQWHGVTSHPPKGSEGLLAALGGRADRFLALGFEHKDHRPKNLPAGGTAIYDANGKVLKFVKDETDLDAGGKPVKIRNATTVTVEGSEKITLKVGSMVVVVKPDRIDLGADPAPHKVVTAAGPSEKVYAVI
jgi:phage gp45-like